MKPSPAEIYHQACTLMAQAELAAAAELFRQILQSPPEASPGRFFIDFSSFLEHSLHFPQRDTQWNLDLTLASHLHLAQIYWQENDCEQALQELKPILYRSPSAELYHLQARWLLELGRIPEALRALNQCLLQNPIYLPAYADLATVANQNGASDLAHKFIRRALSHQLTPRLLEELLLTSTQTEQISMRSIFIELCVQNIQDSTALTLMTLLKSLYAQQDFHHAEYLGFHLLQVFPHEREIMNLYTLAALQQGHQAPALQALLNAPEAFFEEGGHWFKLGMAYLNWKMPDFARFALQQAQSLDPQLEPLVSPSLTALSATSTRDELLSQVLRQAMLSPQFRAELHRAPTALLAHWRIPTEPALLEALQSLPHSTSGAQNPA